MAPELGRCRVAAFGILFVACTPSGKSTRSESSATPVASVAASSPSTQEAVVTPPTPATPAKPMPPSEPIEPTWRGDFCHADADCGWDDPCLPRRCSELATPRPTSTCEAPPLAPGTCSCVEHQCTLRPRDPERSSSSPGSCNTDLTCAIDVGTGTCHADGKTLIGPIDVEGPVCLCDEKTRACAYAWSGPVPCQSWRDCSWAREPRLRAVPSSEQPRPVVRPVRPCKDGEVDAVCIGKDDQKFCRIVAWRC